MFVRHNNQGILGKVVAKQLQSIFLMSRSMMKRRMKMTTGLTRKRKRTTDLEDSSLMRLRLMMKQRTRTSGRMELKRSASSPTKWRSWDRPPGRLRAGAEETLCGSEFSSLQKLLMLKHLSWLTLINIKVLSKKNLIFNSL